MAAPTLKTAPRLDRRELAGLAAATFVVFAIATAFLGHRQLWLDESYSWAESRLGVGALWRFSLSRHGELNMFFDHYLLKPFNSNHLSDLWMRVPSVVATLATVPIVWLIADRLSHRRFVRVAAVLIFITQPVVVDYAFEARAYALLALGLAGTTWLLLVALDGSRRARIAYVVTLPLLVGLHFLGLYVIAAHALALVLITRGSLVHRGREALRYTWLGVVVGAASLLVFHRQGNLESAPPVTLSALLHTAYDLTGRAGPLSVLFGVALVAGVAVLIDRRRSQPEGIVVVTTMVLPVGAAVILSASRPMIGANYQLDVVPLLCCTAAVGLGWAVGDRRLRIAALVAFVGLGLVGQAFVYRHPSRETPDSAARYVLARAQGPDVVAFNAPGTEVPYERYITTSGAVGPRQVGAITSPTVPGQVVTNVPIGRAIADLPAGASVWVIVRHSGTTAGTSGATRALAAAGFELVSTTDFTKVSVEQWRRPS